MSTCPRCNTCLTAAEQEGVGLDSCDRCGGRWIEPDGLKALAERPAPQAEEAGQPPRVEVVFHDPKEGVPCPECRQPMAPFNYAGDSGVILDKCNHCDGIWLDAGELEQVRKVVAASRQDLNRDL